MRKPYKLLPLILSLCLLLSVSGCGADTVLSEIPEDGFTDTVRLKDGNLKFCRIYGRFGQPDGEAFAEAEWSFREAVDYLGSDIPGELTKSLDFLSEAEQAPGDAMTVSLCEDGTLYSGLDFVWELPEKYMADTLGGFDCRLTLSANRENPVQYANSRHIRALYMAPESEFMDTEILTAYIYDGYSHRGSDQIANLHLAAEFTAGGVNYALTSDNLRERYFVEALLELVAICREYAAGGAG